MNVDIVSYYINTVETTFVCAMDYEIVYFAVGAGFYDKVESSS